MNPWYPKATTFKRDGNFDFQRFLHGNVFFFVDSKKKTLPRYIICGCLFGVPGLYDGEISWEQVRNLTKPLKNSQHFFGGKKHQFRGIPPPDNLPCIPGASEKTSKNQNRKAFLSVLGLQVFDVEYGIEVSTMGCSWNLMAIHFKMVLSVGLFVPKSWAHGWTSTFPSISK